jgi:cation-transporting ATPase E
MLGPHLATKPGESPAEWLESGLRVLLFASAPEPESLHDGDEVILPPLQPHAWIAIADTLRPHIQETLKGFADAGIEVKVISGDNPETVAALARQAGLSGNMTLVSGVELADMTDTEFDAAARKGRIFGRISPDQKARLVDSLQRAGAYVAMTGDGVNDVMSLKKANLGISMESGSQATRAVADIILMQDTFSAIPAAFREGQRVRRGLQGVLELFLVRVFVVVVALMLCSIVRVGFPFAPANVALLTTLTVGIPTFGIALWAHPRAPVRSMIGEVATFVVPATATLALAGFIVYTIFYLLADVSLDDLRSGDAFGLMSGNPISRDALTTLLVLAGIGLVPLACPPTTWWAVVEPTEHDWRPTILAALMIPLFIAILRVDALRKFFDVTNLGFGSYLVISLVAVGWLVGLRYVYAAHVYERFFGLKIPDRPE